jgi:hypothetical protein
VGSMEMTGSMHVAASDVQWLGHTVVASSVVGGVHIVVLGVKSNVKPIPLSGQQC